MIQLMESGPPRMRLVRLRSIAAGLAIVWMTVLALAVAMRIGFPLELEWMEGGSLQQAWRIQRGEPIYGPPSADFVPFLYTPAYPALLALLGKLFPLGYVLGRSVSIASMAAIAFGLWRVCRVEGKPREHGWIAIGLFASGYVFGFRWLDLARADAMYLALVLWGLILLRESDCPRSGVRNAALGGLLVALAFWTKQTAAVFVVASGIAGLLIAPRRIWAYAGTIAVIAGGGVLLGQWWTDGWLWTWIYESHQAHAFNDERFRRKTWGMFVHAAPALVAWVAIMAGAELSHRVGRARTRPAAWDWVQSARGPIYWGALGLASLLVSALGYSTQFAEPNAFLPTIVFGAAALAVSLPDGLEPDPAGDVSARDGVLEGIGLVAMSVQLVFALLVEPMYQPIQDRGFAGVKDSYAWQDPWRTIPTREQRAAARTLRNRIESTEGLFALHRPWWSVLSNSRGHVGAMGLNDVDPAARIALEAELRRRVVAGEVGAIWVEGSVPTWLASSLGGWSVSLRLTGERRVRPLSGWMSEAGMVTPWRGEQVLLVRGPGATPQIADAIPIADFEDGTLSGFEVVSGIGFSRRAARSIQPGLPPLGPHGGARLLSSAASPTRLAAKGEVRSPALVVPPSGALDLWIGTSGATEGLGVVLVAEDGRKVELELPETAFDLASVRWSVPDEFAGIPVRLHVIDRSSRAAIFVDDLWIVP